MTQNNNKKQDEKPTNIKTKFLDHLRNHPNVTLAARAAGVNRQYMYELRKEDPVFAQAWDAALDEAIDLLEAEMHRRAFQGVSKPVYQQGKKVGSVREYSDTLAIFLAKAHRPEKFRERQSIEHTGNAGGPLTIEVVTSPLGSAGELQETPETE